VSQEDYDKTYKGQEGYEVVTNTGADGLVISLNNLEGSYADDPEYQSLQGSSVYLGGDGRFHAAESSAPPASNAMAAGSGGLGGLRGSHTRDFVAGVLDYGVGPPPIPGLSHFTAGRLLRNAFDRAAGTSANENSWSYTVGSYVPDVVATVASGGAAASEDMVGVSGRIALDVKPHPFPRLGGRWSHLQLQLWRTGVKGSNFFDKHVPLFCKLDRKWNWERYFKF
jgi:hypothetical protein